MVHQPYSDVQLIQQFTNDNSKAFDKLVERYEQKVFKYVFKIVKNKTITEDILQETFLKVIIALKSGDYKEDGRFLNWILRIARNQTISHFRNENKLKTISIIKNDFGEGVELVHQLADVNCPYKNISLFNTHRRELNQLIKKLSPVNREAIILKINYKMTYNEIKNLNGVCVNSMTSRVKNAIIHMRKMIRENSIELIN